MAILGDQNITITVHEKPKKDGNAFEMDTLFEQILEKLMADEKVRAAMGVWLLDTGCSDHVTNMKLIERQGEYPVTYSTANGMVKPSWCRCRRNPRGLARRSPGSRKLTEPFQRRDVSLQ